MTEYKLQLHMILASSNKGQCHRLPNKHTSRRDLSISTIFPENSISQIKIPPRIISSQRFNKFSKSKKTRDSMRTFKVSSLTDQEMAFSKVKTMQLETKIIKTMERVL